MDTLYVTSSNAEQVLTELEQRTPGSDAPQLRVVIDEAADVFNRGNAARWARAASQSRSLGLRLDVSAVDRALPSFGGSPALRAACGIEFVAR